MKVETSLATTKKQIEDARRFRFQYMCEWNDYYPFTQIDDINDDFDEFTDYLICRVRHEVVGVVRLIKPNPNGFFLEQFIKVDNPKIDRKKTIEFSECIVKPNFRKNRVIVISLMVHSYEYAVLYGYKSGVSISVKSMARAFEKMGFTNTGKGAICGWQKHVNLMIMENISAATKGIDKFRHLLN